MPSTDSSWFCFISSLATVTRSMRSPRCVQLAHAQEDAAMLLQAEVVGFERAGDLDVERVVHQDRAQDEALGVEIGRESAFERDVRRRCCHKPTVLH